jgi:hypothetical protein
MAFDGKVMSETSGRISSENFDSDHFRTEGRRTTDSYVLKNQAQQNCDEGLWNGGSDSTDDEDDNVEGDGDGSDDDDEVDSNETLVTKSKLDSTVDEGHRPQRRRAPPSEWWKLSSLDGDSRYGHVDETPGSIIVDLERNVLVERSAESN